MRERSRTERKNGPQKLHFEPLEPRILLNADPWNVTLAAAGAYTLNTVEVTQNGETEKHFQIIADGGAVVDTRKAAETSRINVTGSPGNDTLTIDFDAVFGVPSTIFALTSISFDGGAGNDNLIFAGGAFDSLSNSATGAGAGTMALDPHGTTHDTLSDVTYSGLQSIALNSAIDSLTHVATSGDDDVTVENDSQSGHSRITADQFVNLFFANPSTRLTIDTGAGNDAISLKALDEAFTAQLVLRYGNEWGEDTLTLDGYGDDLTLDFASHDGALSAELFKIEGMAERRLEITSDDGSTLIVAPVAVSKLSVVDASFEVDLDSHAGLFDALAAGLDGLEAWADEIASAGLFGVPLPFVSKDTGDRTEAATLGRIVHLAETVREAFDEIKDKLDSFSSLQLLDELLALADLEADSEHPLGASKLEFGFTSFGISPVFDNGNLDELLFAAGFSGSANSTLELDLGDTADLLGVSFEADVTLRAELEAFLAFGAVGIASSPNFVLGREFLERKSKLGIEGHIQADVDAQVNLGFLGASIIDGRIDVTGAATATINEQITNLSDFTDKVGFQVDTANSHFDVDLPFQVTLGANLFPGAPDLSGTLHLFFGDSPQGDQLAHILSGRAPEISIVTDSGIDLMGFTLASPSDVFGLFEQFASWIVQLTGSGLLELPIPFTEGKTVGDVLVFARSLQETLIDPLFTEVNDPNLGKIREFNFSNIQSLAETINQSLDQLSVGFISVGLNFEKDQDENPTALKELTLALDWSQTFDILELFGVEGGNLPLAFGFDLGDFGGIQVTQGTLGLTATVDFGFVFGIDLQPTGDLGLGLPLFVPNPPEKLVKLGQLRDGNDNPVPASFNIELVNLANGVNNSGNNATDIGVTEFEVVVPIARTQDNIAPAPVVGSGDVHADTTASTLVVQLASQDEAFDHEHISDNSGKFFVQIIGGTASGEIRKIESASAAVADNSAFKQSFSLADDFGDAVPDNSSRYRIVTGLRVGQGTANAATASTLTQDNARFNDIIDLDHGEYWVEIVDGQGRGSVHKITDVSENGRTLTIQGNWSQTPGTGSRYEIFLGDPTKTLLHDLQRLIDDQLVAARDHATEPVDQDRLGPLGPGSIRVEWTGTRYGLSASGVTLQGFSVLKDDGTVMKLTLQEDGTTYHDPDGNVVVLHEGIAYEPNNDGQADLNAEIGTVILGFDAVDRLVVFKGIDSAGIARDQLGLLSSPIPFNGQLTGDAEFELVIDGVSTTILVAESSTADNSSVADLVDDINRAIWNALFPGNAEGFDLDQLPVKAEQVRVNGRADGNRIQFVGTDVARLELRPPVNEDGSTDTTSVAYKELGLTEIVKARIVATEFFIEPRADEDDEENDFLPLAAGSLTLSINDFQASAQLGFLGVDLALDESAGNQLTAGVKLDLVRPDTGDPGRLSIQELWDEVSARRFLFGQYHPDSGRLITDPNHEGDTTQGGLLKPGVTLVGDLGLTVTPSIEGASFLSSIGSVDLALSIELKDEDPRQNGNGENNNGNNNDSILPPLTTVIDGGSILGQRLGFLVLEAELSGDLLGLINSLRNLNFQSIIQALRLVVDFLESLEGEGAVGDVLSTAVSTPLPLVNQSISDMLSAAQEFASYVDRALSDPAGSVQELNAVLRGQLGLGEDGNGEETGFSFDLNLVFDPGNSGENIPPALRLDFNFGALFEAALPIDLNLVQLAQLAGADAATIENLNTFIGLGASGGLNITLGADLALALGVPLIVPGSGEEFQPFIYAGKDDNDKQQSKLSFDIEILGENLDFDARFGPLGVFVRGGTAALTGNEPGQRAGVDITLGDSNQRIPFTVLFDFDAGNEQSLANLVVFGIRGRADINLPLHFPTDDFFIDNLTVTIPDLAAFLDDLIAQFSGNDDPGALSVQNTNTNPSVILGGIADLLNIPVPSLLDLILDPLMLVDGLDSLLNRLESTLRTQLKALNLPLIGDALDPAADFINDFRADLLAPIASFVRAGLEQFDFDLPDSDRTNPRTDFALQGLLFNIFGSGTASDFAYLGDLDLTAEEFAYLKLDDAGDVRLAEQVNAFGLSFGTLGILRSQQSFDENGHRLAGTFRDIVLSGHDHGDGANQDFIQLDLILGDTFRFVVPLGFDIGVPALGLEVDANLVIEFDWELHFGFGIDLTQGFYFVTNTDNPNAPPELRLTGNVFFEGDNGASLEGRLGILKLTLVDAIDTDEEYKAIVAAALGIPVSQVDLNNLPDDDRIPPRMNRTGLSIDILVDLKDPNSDGRLTFAEMVSKSTKVKDVIAIDVIGAAHVGLAATVDFSVLEDLDVPLPVGALPAIDFGFILDWEVSASLINGSINIPGAPDIWLRSIELNLGSFISEFAGPILDILDTILGPLEWLIGPDGLLNKRIPIISDLAGTTISLRTLAEIFDQNAKITPFLNAAAEIFALLQMVNDARQEAEDGGLILSFGHLHLNSLFGNGNGELADLRNVDSLGSLDPSKLSSFIGDLNPLKQQDFKDSGGNFKPGAAQFTRQVTVNKPDRIVSFPIIEDPMNIFKLLLGMGEVDLAVVNLPELVFSFAYRQQFPVFGPLVATLGGSFTAALDLALGYDSRGITAFRATNNPFDLLDGLFFFDHDPVTGEPKPEAYIRGELAAGAALSLGVAKAGVEGGIAATIFFDFNDPDGDGRIRLGEMANNILANLNLGPLAPLAIFDITGLVEWFFRAYVEVNLAFFKFSKSLDLGGGVIFEFEIPFNRDPVLATQSGNTLTLNIGPNAESRNHGNNSDISETIFVVSDGPDETSTVVRVWGMGVPEARAQRFVGVTEIVADTGKGNDTIDLSGVTSQLINANITGGTGSNTLLGTGGTSDLFGGPGNSTLTLFGLGGAADGGPGFNTIYGGSINPSPILGGTFMTGPGGGIVTLVNAQLPENPEDRDPRGDYIFVADSGKTIFDAKVAPANSISRFIFGEGVGAQNFVYGPEAAGAIGVLDFSEVILDITFILGEQTINVDGVNKTFMIEARYGDNRVFADENIHLIVGGRGNDAFHVFATRADGITLDGSRGSDDYYFYAADPDAGTPPPMNVTLRDTGSPWDQDRAIIVGSEGDDDIIVTNTQVFINYGDSSFDPNGSNVQVITYNNFDELRSLDPRVRFDPAVLTVDNFNDALAEEIARATGDNVEDVEFDEYQGIPAGIELLDVRGRNGNDLITVESSPFNMGVQIQSFGRMPQINGNGNGNGINIAQSADNIIVVGGDRSAISKSGNEWVIPFGFGDLTGIAADPAKGGFLVKGTGLTNDTLIIDDSGTTANRMGELDVASLGFFRVSGLALGSDFGVGATPIPEGVGPAPGELTDVVLTSINTLDIRLGKGNDRFDILATGEEEAPDEGLITPRPPIVIDIVKLYGGDGGDRLNLFSSHSETHLQIFGDYPVDLAADNFRAEGDSRPLSDLGRVGGNDFINIFGTMGTLEIFGGPGDDTINIKSIDAETFVFGGRGNDTIRVGVELDATMSDAIPHSGTPGGFQRNEGNQINAELSLNGQDGGDNYLIWLAGEGESTINVFDTGESGGDFLRIFGSEHDDLFLIRAGVSTDNDIGLGRTGQIGFVALLNEGRASTREDVERVNYARDADFNTGINGNVQVHGGGGFGQFYVDDTLGPMTLLGATGGNYFQFGQLYNSPRADNEFANILPEDEFATVETTRGWLSNGISFDLSALGAEEASNEFVVLNNQATLNLYGGDRNDRFVVRSFALVGSVDPKRENIDISTGGGENYIEYVVGATVNIDGRGGFNTLVVIGTEFADDYVITEDGIFGAGRLVNFVNIQQLEVDGAEGNDRFFIQGVAPDTSVVLSGGLGSDAFFVGGETPDIISRDLKGHSGIISHSVSSVDPAFNGIKVDEISANLADNDEAAIVVTESGGHTTVVEGAVLDFYTVVLTRAPTGTVTVTASVPTRPVKLNGDRELRPIVHFSNEENGAYGETVELVFNESNWFIPQEVWIKVAGDQGHEGIVSGFVSHNVAGDQMTGTTTTAIRVAGQDPNLLIDEEADFGPDDSLRGAIVQITQGPGKGQSRLVIGNTATMLILDKPWVLDPFAADDADLPGNQSTYQIRLYDGLAIPAVQVKAYHADVGAAILAPSGGLTVVEQTTNGLDADAEAPFVASYQIVLTEAPAADVTVDLLNSDGLMFFDADGNPISSLTFDSTNWNTPQTVKVAIAADGEVQKERTLEIGHSIGGHALERVFVRVIDGDSPSVVITESSGETNIIEGGGLTQAALDGDKHDLTNTELVEYLTSAPFVDTYTVVLSKQPTDDVYVVVRAEGTRTSKGNMVNFGEQVELAIQEGGDFFSYRLADPGEVFDATNGDVEVDGTLYKRMSGAGGIVVLKFTSDNWSTPQTVYVQALDDEVIDGGDTKVFGTRSDDTSRIQGPLEIRGGGGQGSLVGLPIPVLFPHFRPSNSATSPDDNEANDFIPTGSIQLEQPAQATSLVVSREALEAFIIRYGLDFDLEAGEDILDALIGTTFRILTAASEGEIDNGNEFEVRFTPQLNDNPPPVFLEPAEDFNPFDIEHQLTIPFREIIGWSDEGEGLIRLFFPVDLPWLNPIVEGQEFVIINASPANFFAREDEQVDLLFVRDTDADTDEEGRLIFHTEDPTDDDGEPIYDVPLENRGQIVGLGMGEGRSFDTNGDGILDFRLPGGIVFDEIEMLEITLGSGNDRFVIEGTHSGATRLNTGAGNDVVEVWSVAGPTTIDGGFGDDIIHVGMPEDGKKDLDPAERLNSLAQIAALLTIAGDVPEAFARTTVRGEPDVVSKNGGLLAEGSTNEQEIFLVNADGGFFTLRFKGAVEDAEVQSPVGYETAAIPFGADAEAIKQALLDLRDENDEPLLREGDFEVERFGNRIVIRFTADSAFAKTPMHVFGVSSAQLTSSSTTTLNVRGSDDVGDVWALLTQTTLTGLGMPVFNAIQTIYVDDPLPGEELREFTLSFEGETTGSLNVAMTAAEVQAALEALDTIGAGNVAVSKVDKVFVIRFQGEFTNQVVPVLESEYSHVHIAVRELGIAPQFTDPDTGAPIPPSADSLARNDLQTLTIEATGGSFVLEMGGEQTGPIAYNATAAEVREALQRLLPDRFADDIAVLRFGNVYHILFQGLLRTVMEGPGTGFLKVDPSGLDGTAEVTTRMDGINYYGIHELNIAFGPASENAGGHVLNVQGTSTAVTNINLNAGDDRIFISSDADLDHNTLFPAGAAFGFDFLTGHLDLIAGDINIDAGEGRHQLMISDEATALAKGTDADPVTIQRETSGLASSHDVLEHIEIEILNWTGGAIRYGAAENANFFDGITMWGGAEGNLFKVDATHLREDGPFSTLTTLNSGKGDDAIFISLEAEEDGPIVLNAQEGDDWVDARGSTLPLILIGHDGDDVIFGGDGGDIIFGDRARIIHYDDAQEKTVIGHGGRFDFTDGRLDLPNLIKSIIHEADGIVLEGGRDVLVGGDGDDVIFGGSGSDIIDGDAGRDLIIGDNAELDRRETQGVFTNPRFRALLGEEIYDTAMNAAGDLLINRNNQYADPEWGENPPVWGDLVITLHDGLTVPEDQDAQAWRTQGNNYIAGGAGSDMIFGQSGDNTIQGDGSIFWDVWLGHGDETVDRLGGWVALEGLDQADPNRSEFNRHTFNLAELLTPRPESPTKLPRSFEANTDGDDYIEGGAGNDVIFGNLGQNDIIGGSSNLFGLTEARQRDSSGANIIFGGAGTRIDRNDPGYDEDGSLIPFEDRHARNASVILGDNGNIFRLVGTNGADSGGNMTFNYDANDPTRGDLRIKARGVDLLDYKRWELAQAAGIAVPGHLSFDGVIGAGDLIHGESGDDVIFGMGGDNVIFGHAGDDLIVGGFGNNWISGGTGDDGILGDDGLIFISRNSPHWGEPLYGIGPVLQQDIITPSGQFNERINVEGAIKHTARLFGFAYEHGGNDIVYGGLGNDSLHGGAGNDALSGAEALPGYFTGELNWLMKLTQKPIGDNNPENVLAPEAWFYNVAPYNPGNILQPSNVVGQWFRLYNPTDPLRLILLDSEGNLATEAEFHYSGTLPSADDPFDFDLSLGVWTVPGGDPNNPDDILYDFFLNFDPTEGERDTRFPEDLARVSAGIPSDGDDVIFGNLGNNWIVGGSGRDHIWGGFGDNVLNADDNHHTTLFGTDPIANDREDPYQAYADIVFGGAGRDVLIGNTGADRLIDWLGEFNTYVVPFNPIGGLQIWRLSPSPHLLEFLLTLSRADGADQLLGLERGGDPDRQGEPYGEIALVTRKDAEWSDQRGSPAKPFPKMYPGQRQLMWRAFPDHFSGPGGGQPAAQSLSSNIETQETWTAEGQSSINGPTNGSGQSGGNGKANSKHQANSTSNGATDDRSEVSLDLLFDPDSGAFDEGRYHDGFSADGYASGLIESSVPSYSENGIGKEDWLVQGAEWEDPATDEEDDWESGFVWLESEEESEQPAGVPTHAPGGGRAMSRVK